MSTLTNNQLTAEEVECLRGLYNRGFAICIFTPAELGEADPEAVQDVCIMSGWSFIHNTHQNL